MSNLRAKIEAILFGLGRPLSYSELARMLEAPEEALKEAVGEESGSGVRIVDDGRVLELRASPEVAALIEKARKEEVSREIGRAGLEVLSAILYRGPLSRSEVDFIRGVNSSQTLRTLTMRGLVRKVPNPRDERSFLYVPTTDLYAQLGITSASELPNYAQVKSELENLEKAYRAREEADHG